MKPNLYSIESLYLFIYRFTIALHCAERIKMIINNSWIQRFRWSRGSVLAFDTQVREFKPGRSRRIFQGEKNFSTSSFGREVKLFVPCRIFAACIRTRKCMRGSRSFRSKLPAISRLSSSSFHYQGLWWRHLAEQVGRTKDQGLYNKPSAAVHAGALAAGTLPQYIT